MSAGPGTTAKGLAADGAEGGQPDVPASPAGRLLARLSVLPALLAMAWLLAGLPLLLVGGFTAVLMLVLSIPLAVVLVVLGQRGRDRGRVRRPADDLSLAADHRRP